MSSSAANRRGILALVASMAAFSTNDTLVKLVAKSYPLGEVLFVRGVMASALIAAFIVWSGHLAVLRMRPGRIVTLRSVLEGVSTFLFTSALVHMPVAELSAVLLVAPLILTALAIVFLKETVGWRRWAAIAVGFVGTLFVVKPTPGAFDVWAMVGLGCACVAAVRDFVTRRIAPTTPTVLVSFLASVAAAVVGALMGPFEHWQPIAPGTLALLAVIAALLAVGHSLLVVAFRGADVSVVSPFRYTILIWAAIGGYLAFGEVPDRWAMVGAGLIVASGLYALHRETVRRRAAAG